MKKGLLVLFTTLISSQALAIDSEKGAFFTSLSLSSPEVSTYTFMIDQFLEAKCGKPQPIKVIKKGSETHIYVLIALKDGHYKEATSILNKINCFK